MRRHEEEGKPGRLVFSEPKNASRRTVDLPQRALVALKRHRKRQLKEKLAAGGSYEDSGPCDSRRILDRSISPVRNHTTPTSLP